MESLIDINKCKWGLGCWLLKTFNFGTEKCKILFVLGYDMASSKHPSADGNIHLSNHYSVSNKGKSYFEPEFSIFLHTQHKGHKDDLIEGFPGNLTVNWVDQDLKGRLQSPSRVRNSSRDKFLCSISPVRCISSKRIIGSAMLPADTMYVCATSFVVLYFSWIWNLLSIISYLFWIWNISKNNNIKLTFCDISPQST